MARSRNPLRIPKRLRHDVEQIFAITDPFCAEHLDAEYGALVRKLVAKLARKRPSPLVRGDLRIWAAAAIYTIGSINFLFDRTQRPHLAGNDLSALTGVPKSTLANKAKLIRDTLRNRQMEPEFCRRELLESSPTAWLISVNGYVVDARMMPPEVQAEARRRGLIPDLPSDEMNADHGGGESNERRENAVPGPVHEPTEESPSMGLAAAVRDVADIIRGQPGSASDGPDGWERIVRIKAEHGSLPDSEVEALVKDEHGATYRRSSSRRPSWRASTAS